MGSAQIKELADTAKLAKKGIECCYIVNDDIYRVADVMRSIAG
jgi:hypothetical protein